MFDRYWWSSLSPLDARIPQLDGWQPDGAGVTAHVPLTAVRSPQPFRRQSGGIPVLLGDREHLLALGDIEGKGGQTDRRDASYKHGREPGATKARMLGVTGRSATIKA